MTQMFPENNLTWLNMAVNTLEFNGHLNIEELALEGQINVQENFLYSIIDGNDLNIDFDVTADQHSFEASSDLSEEIRPRLFFYTTFSTFSCTGCQARLPRLGW